jgi:hypothetical protein
LTPTAKTSTSTCTHPTPTRNACDKAFPLWDDLEKLFGSETLQQSMRELAARDEIKLDSRRKGKLLVRDVGTRLTRLDQKFIEIPGTEDEGIDMELEFTQNGKGSGKRLYLQLQAGNSHLRTRKNDGAEIFDIKEPRWVEYWLKQPFPVMLVIGTFPEDIERSGRQKQPFEKVRWMEISSVLRRDVATGKTPKHIVFEAENMDETSILRWRDAICRES